MIRVDFHTNLGFIPKTKKKVSQELYISPQVLADFLNKYNITHTVVLYSSYSELETLDTLTPNTKLYGLRWIDNIEEIIKDPSLLDIGKPLWAGVKFHSHRSFTIDKDTGERVYGLDYSDKRLIHKILDQLPDNSIINMHMQGSASLQNQASPRALYTHALVYPNLKFIISHMGCYGKGSFQPADKYYPPSTRAELSKEHKYHLALQKIATFSEMLVWDAVYIANRMDNCWLNTAILYPLKREPLKHTDRWGIGSDFPFTHTTPQNWDEHSYDVQENMAKNYVGEEKALASHQKTLDWIEKDICKTPKKKWITFFSRSGSEILNLSNKFQSCPDLILHTKSRLELEKTELWKELRNKTIFQYIWKDIKTKEFIELLESFDINPNWDTITLHGYLRVLPSRLVKRFPMVNLHPGLIDKYPELKGLDPQKRGWENRELYSHYGCVLHKVIGKVDEGEIIDSEAVSFEFTYSKDEYYKDLSDIAIDLWTNYLTTNLEIELCNKESHSAEVEG